MAVIDRWHRKDKVTGKRVRTSRYGKGKRWSAQWVDAAGKRQSLALNTKDEANASLALISADLLRGTYLDPAKGTITFRKFAEGWFASADHSATTKRQMPKRFVNHVYPYLGDLQLKQITPSVIRSWLKALKSTKSQRHNPELHDWVPTLSGSFQYLLFVNVSTLLNAAVGDELIAKNPMHHTSISKPKKDTAPAIPWAVDRIAAVEKELAERWKIVHTLGLGCGLRGGEIFGLDPFEDIDWENQIIHVRRQTQYLDGAQRIFKLPKYNKTRSIPMPLSVAQRVKRHMEQFPPKVVTLPWGDTSGEPVKVRLLLSTELGMAMTSKSFTQSIWSKACRDAGFTPVPNRDGPHVLRHTFVSRLLDSGESIVTVSSWLGHANPEITYKVYAHMLPESEERTRNAIDEFFKQPGMPDLDVNQNKN